MGDIWHNEGGPEGRMGGTLVPDEFSIPYHNTITHSYICSQDRVSVLLLRIARVKKLNQLKRNRSLLIRSQLIISDLSKSNRKVDLMKIIVTT